VKTPTTTNSNNAPQSFLDRYGDHVIGILQGFDRLRFRGTLRQLYCPQVMERYLSASHVLIKDFGSFVERTSKAVKDQAQALASKWGRPMVFVPSSRFSKEDLVRKLAAKDQITQGLIAVLNAVEPCQSFSVRGNRQTRKIEIKVETRKCSHLYFYYEHARFGFMHLRLQTWFPFRVDLCLNGRHWLARQLDQAGIAYQKKENTFVRVADLAQAQRLLDEQQQIDWPKELATILKTVHPLSQQICRPLGLNYYWSAADTEFATDVMFKNAASLAQFYPTWVHHALSSFSSADVMRFLGRYVPISTGQVCGRFDGEITSQSKRRPEGVRVKHSVNGNSIKFYDKQGSVLRVETTIIQPQDFKVFRTPEGRPDVKKRWLPLRRGLADLRRRAEVSQKANHRYLEALAATRASVPLFEWVDQTCQPVTREGRRYRGLNPWSKQDSQLLEVVNRGEFALNGFRNRDVCRQFYKPTSSLAERKRRMARIGRQLRLLRAHGLLQKVGGTHRYVVTEKGRLTITALLTARKADVQQLTKMAA
jgi:hypothetical protein